MRVAPKVWMAFAIWLGFVVVIQLASGGAAHRVGRLCPRRTRTPTIGELAHPFGLTLNGMKKHVGILEDVDLVVTAKVGHARKCQLGPTQLDDATEWIDDVDALGTPGWTGSASKSRGKTADDEPGRAIREGDQRPARRGVR